MTKIEKLIIWEKAYARIVYDPEGVQSDELIECEEAISKLRKELNLCSYEESVKEESKYWEKYREEQNEALKMRLKDKQTFHTLEEKGSLYD